MFASEIPLALPPFPFITAAAMTSSPLPIAWCEFNPQAWHSDLHQHWQLPLPLTLHKAVTKRKAEHLASRWLAQQMLAHFSMPDFILRNAPDRSPVWPVGIHASLSHCRQMAVIAATQEPLCIGVDIEQVMEEQTAEETAGMMMSRAEHQRLVSAALPFSAAATLLFSLKECVYKALWPQLHQPMDFLQAELLEWDLARGRATLTLTQDFSREFNANTHLQAHFWRRGDRVITLIAHPLNNT